MRPFNSAVAFIAERFEARFREHPLSPRKVGREAEFPLVWPDGRAGDAGRLWEPLMAEGGFTPEYDDPGTQSLIVSLGCGDTVYGVEVGRGTVEVSVGPFDDLWELQAGFERALAQVANAAASRGMRLLGFGIQPRTPPTASLMTPRRHYQALYSAIGAPWLRLTTTAADQTHVDICRAEVLDAINWMNLLSGPIIALCANSAVYSGRAGQYLSGREGLLRDLGEFRYGMPPQRFASVADYVQYLCDYPCYVLPDGPGYRRVNRPFAQIVHQSGGEAFDGFLWHEHYVWNSARARVKNSTIEVRPACQQPAGEPLAANALILGWVEVLPQIAEFVTGTLGPDPWPAMARYRRDAVRAGLSAPEPAKRFLENLVKMAEDGLMRRGRTEEVFLKSVWNRLERCESPAMRARAVMQQAGMERLIETIRLRD